MTTKPTAWVTGAGGLIGSHVVKAASELAPAWKVIGLTRQFLELTRGDAVELLFQEHQPGLIIHCAAMSRSPECQRNPEQARLLNIEVTRRLTDLATTVPLVFFSTDLVFDGRKGNYVETDPVNPMSVYAGTKLAGEEIVLKNPMNLVIRTSLNAGKSPTGDRGMDEQMIQAWRAGKILSLFDDEFRCPIPASGTARAVWELIGARATGLHHVAGSEKLSRWQIGELLTSRHPEFKSQITRGSLKDYEGAPRSPDTSLISAKAEAVIGHSLPRFSDWLSCS